MLFNDLGLNSQSGYVMDLHPNKNKQGAKTAVPCGVTTGVLDDLYGSRRLDLTGDPTKEPPPIETEGGVEGQDCIKTDPAARGSDKGSGLVWLLGDPAKVPEPLEDAPKEPEAPFVDIKLEEHQVVEPIEA